MSLRTRVTPLVTVIGAVTIPALAANGVAAASGGHGFLLGRKNVTAGQSILARTQPGPVLTLSAKKASSPPFTTNATGKVVNLNADRLDGLDSAALVNRTLAYQLTTSTGSTSLDTDIPTPSPGSYLMTYTAYLAGGSGSSFCELDQSGSAGARYLGVSQLNGTSFPGLTGTALVSVAAGDTLSLICSSGTAFTLNSTSPLQLELVPTSATAHTLTASKQSRGATTVTGPAGLSRP